MHALAFDLGGTHLRGGLVGPDGLRAVTSRRIQNGDDVSGQNGIWEQIVTEMILYERRNAAELHPADPIVISFPGPIAGNRHILHAPTVCGTNTDFLDLAARLEQETGRPVHLLNDVSAAAWCLGSGTDVDRFLVVTVSSGIGSKIFDRRHAARVLDEPAYAGEIGHLVVDDGPCAPVCDCGGRGHLGAIASGRGVERTARRRAREDAAGFSRSCVHTCRGGLPDSLTNEHHIVPAVLGGDAWALAVLRDCTRPLARTLLCSTMAMGLERVFIIGGFAQALGAVYLDLLSSLVGEISQYSMMRDRIDSLIAPGYTCGEPCLLGCRAFLEHLYGVGGSA
jgi:C7-cyclitol 7-kinase